jgi:SNF2 family DNA or RNA helicase
MVNLTENDKQIIQPSTISIPLMSHQKTIIKRMLDIEDCDEYDIKYKPEYFSVNEVDAKMQTNIGILADKVGAGKTLSTISIISMRPILKDKMTCCGGNKYMGLKVNLGKTNLNTNLIIVPSKLVPQWKAAFLKVTNLSVYPISTNGQIDKIIIKETKTIKNWTDEDIIKITDILDIEKVKIYNVIIIGDTMYKRFYKCAINYKWNRIFIDEADTIKLPRDMECHFNFLWLITGTPSGLSNNSNSFLGKIFYNDSRLKEYITFKNDNKYIEQSIVLPHPKRIQIRCITPRELLIIKDLIPGSILQMINAGNSDEAIKALNCNVDTNENILQVITKNLVDSIGNKQIELDAEMKKHYPPTQIKDQDYKIKIINNSLTKLQEKYDHIKKKMYELNNDYCPVCMSSFTNPVIVNCCKNCFCFDCLAVSMGELKNNICPFCRQGICKSDIHLISNDVKLKSKVHKTDMKDKLDVLVDLIKMKPDGSFMVFANYIETFSKIEKKLAELDISYHILKGQAGTVAKYIDDFKEKKVRVLMLNAQYFGAGMNLQMTTDLVIYHRFTKEMEEQIIGRAQRLGRTTPLNVYYLIHDNESSNIEDKFNSEDIKDIHYLDWIEQQNKEQNKEQNNEPIYNDTQLVIDSYSNELGDINNKINSIPQSKFTNNNYIIKSEKSNTKIINDGELSDIEYLSESDIKSKTNKLLKNNSNGYSPSDELEEIIHVKPEKKPIIKKTNKKPNIKIVADSDSDSDSNVDSNNKHKIEYMDDDSESDGEINFAKFTIVK